MGDFWGTKINVSKEAAARQVAIINTFSQEKRAKIALDFANMGISQTHAWIKSRNPEFSDLEVKKEFVRLIYFENGDMPMAQWEHCKNTFDEMIKKDWANRFRNMMSANNWSYDDVARWGRFKNGKVVEATISRGLPAFAKLAVILFERGGLAQNS
ncbi:MAG: hypothetical protein AAF655_25350 [Bacteroidota bacterium]